MPLRAAAPPPVVFFVVASSPPLTTSTTSSLTTCRCAFCAWSSSSCSSSFFADFYDCRRHDHYDKLAGLWASARLLYHYASSSMTSSPPPFSLLRLLRLFRQTRAASASSPSPFCAATVVETSTGPLHSATWLCALPCTSGIGNTDACLHPRRATGLANPVLASALAV